MNQDFVVMHLRVSNDHIQYARCVYNNKMRTTFEFEGSFSDRVRLFAGEKITRDAMEDVPEFCVPELEDSLRELRLCILKINKTTLMIPAALVSLELVTCCLSEIPELPGTLEKLNCSNNWDLATLPRLPPGLVELCCGNCAFTSLPELPPSLTFLYFPGNKVSRFPGDKIPENLGYLNCGYNRLETLPKLPNCLNYLNASNNCLREFQDIQEPRKSFITIYLSGNPLTSFPNVGRFCSDISFEICLLRTEYKVFCKRSHRYAMNMYLVILKLIRYLRVKIRIPMEITRYLMLDFITNEDLQRLV